MVTPSAILLLFQLSSIYRGLCLQTLMVGELVFRSNPNIYFVQFRSDGGEVIWYVLLDLFWLSSQNLPESRGLLVLHEGHNLCFPLTLILIYLFSK